MAKKKGKNILKNGRFYNVRDGSEKGHPGKIVSIDKKNGEYTAIITETSYNKGLIPIHPTDNRVKKSYLKPFPFLGTRNDFGDKEYEDMVFDNDALIKAEDIKKKPYVFGYHYQKKYKMK